MFEDKRILGIIPARGGSKGIPHKNIAKLCRRPLISYTIDAGLKSKYIDFLIVSTDDEAIAHVAKENGAEVPFMRPGALASDTSKTLDTVLHAITTLKERGQEFYAVVLLQPTGPLRTSEDIDLAIEKFFRCNCRSLVSVSEVHDHPILIRTIEDDNMKTLLQTTSTCCRQDMPKYYRVNGCIYINLVDELNDNTSFNDNIIPFIMPKDHSIDIDEWGDLALAEYYLKQRS